jgi:hypothetical protein
MCGRLDFPFKGNGVFLAETRGKKSPEISLRRRSCFISSLPAVNAGIET